MLSRRALSVPFAGLPLLSSLILAGLIQAQPKPASQPAHAAVKVWEEPLVLPTYELGAPDPNPVFMDVQRGRTRPVYPYPMLDSLTNRRVDKSYKALYLENEYLKVTVLPEFGGHLYAIFDKVAKRDLLYTNHVVKYGIVAIRGAWISGGIEWNFPDGHTVTSVAPIDYAFRTEPDGAASVTVGDTERIQRMQWAVTVRLRPGWRVVETEVRLNNRRETPGRYWYWATAAAKASDDMRFVYPMREAYPHVFWPVFSFPKEKGVDVGTYREVTNPLSLFSRNSMRDFMSVYYEKADWGVVHVADHRELPGKKTWTWGTADSGKIWVDKLTDNDGQYVEFQAGRYETQMEHQFIAPHRVEHFTEYWFPAERLGGGLTEANRNASLNVRREGSRLNIWANANTDFPSAALTVDAPGKRLYSRQITFSPKAPLTMTVDLAAGAGEPLTIGIRNREGDIIIYRTDTPIDGNPAYKPATRPTPDPAIVNSAEQAHVKGIAADKKSDEKNARTAYQEALKRDPGYAPALTALGLSYYRTGEYDKSAKHLEEALRRNPDAGDAHYYLGLTSRAQGRNLDATQHLLWAVRAGYREPAARFVLGELAIAEGKFNDAIDHLSAAVSLDGRDVKARTVLALAERLAGKLDSAQARIDAVVREMPIDYLALSEQSAILRERGKELEGARARTELWSLLSREPDAVLELAFDYAAVGRNAEAIRVLGQSMERFKNAPMLNYTLGYFMDKSGETERARTQFALGAKADPALVFPHRVEEIAVLKAALAANPKDGRAWYYIGNALASKERRDEAISAWRQAVEFEPSNAVAHRNLGQFLSGDEAVAAYERAIRSAPGDFHLYAELDKLLAAGGNTQRRIQLLEKAPAEVRSNQAIIQAIARAYADAGQFEESAKLLVGTEFVSGEGENSVLVVYRKAQAGLARKHAQAGRHEAAAAEFLKATEYPRNLGVGRPSPDPQGYFYVCAARQLEAAGKAAEAASLWRKAAEEALKSPTEPLENWSENYYYKAVALEKLGRKADARALYERLANLNDDERMASAEPLPPEGAVRYMLAGLGLKGLGKTADAKTALEKALRLDPANDIIKEEIRNL